MLRHSSIMTQELPSLSLPDLVEVKGVWGLGWGMTETLRNVAEQRLGAKLPPLKSGPQRQSPSLCLSFPRPKIEIIVPALEVVVRMK